MRPTFHPVLTNGPFDDPTLFIPFIFEKRAFIFDLGDVSSLSTKNILKISHAFVTHTHMDHFIGFDRLLRLLLGRNKTLCLFGPNGFIKNIEGKLSGYTWNLVEGYKNGLILDIYEIQGKNIECMQYHCKNGFLPGIKTDQKTFEGLLLEEPALKISGIILNHQIPCMGYKIEERFHINIKKDSIEKLKLEVGPWIDSFKTALFAGQDPHSPFEIISSRNERKTKQFALGELAEEIALITPGQKIAYITDIGYSKSNGKKVVEFSKHSDHLFIEASFLEKDRKIAERKNHLTAWQAGILAKKAGVKQFTVFHFSPRYKGREALLYREAELGYNSKI